MLVAHAGGVRPRPRVVLGTDGSAEARFAADTLMRFADRHRCRIEVVSVAVSLVPDLFPLPGFSYATSGPTPVIEERLLAGPRHIAEREAGRMRDAGFRVTATAVIYWAPWDAPRRSPRPAAPPSSWSARRLGEPWTAP